MDDDTEPLSNKDNYPSRTFYDFSRCIPKSNVRRQTRHAASDASFGMHRDLVRIPENGNVRRKRHTKPQHCPSCLPSSVHNHSIDSHPDDQHRHKNPEKLEASLTRPENYITSKITRSHGKNRSFHQQGSPLSPRAISANRRSQHHRPGTSQNRNNLNNTMGHRFVQKHRNIEPRECTRLDSTLRHVVNSDDPTEDTDFQLPYEHMVSRNICQESDLYWHSPPGEPHSEPELDSPRQDRYRDYTEPKTRHTGQGANTYDNYRALDAKVLIETGSSVDNQDVRDQYERDQQVLKDLYKDVGKFEKRKNTVWVANDVHEEKCAWTHPKQQPEGEKEGSSQYLLESINQFVGKLPVQRKRNTRRVVTAEAAKAKAHSKTRQDQSRAQDAKLDTRKTYHSVGMDRRTGGNDQQQEVERNFDEKFASIHLENLIQEEKKEKEETKEVETLSETEEEARELAREDHATKLFHRQLQKDWDLCKRYSSTWKPRISGKGEINTRGLVGNEEERMHGKPDCEQKEANTRERSKGKRNKEVMICKESASLKQDDFSTNKVELKDSTWTNTRERSRERQEISDKMYEEFKNCYSASATHGAGDLDLETSKTRTCIDEIIDSSLNREAKRGSGETLRTTTKDLFCEAHGLETSPLRQGLSEGMSINIRSDSSSPVLRSDHIRAPRGDCFCKTLAEIVTDCQGPKEYMKKLKNCRLAYLNHMQSDLQKLYSLEQYLISCSVERQSSSATLTTGCSPESKDSKNTSDKKDKAKGSET